MESVQIAADLTANTLEWTATIILNHNIDQFTLPLFTLDGNTILNTHTIQSDQLRTDKLLLNHTTKSLSLEIRPGSPVDSSSSPPRSPPTAEADEGDKCASNRCIIVLQLSTHVTPAGDCVTLSVPRSPRNSLSFISSSLEVGGYSLDTIPPLSTNDEVQNKGTFASTDTLSLNWTLPDVGDESELRVAHHALEVEYQLKGAHAWVVAKGRCEGVQTTGRSQGSNWMDLVVLAAQIEQLSVIGESITGFGIVDSSLPCQPTRPSTRSRSGSPSKLPPSPSPLRLYPRPSSLLHDFQVRPPLRYSSQPDSYASLFDTPAPPTPAVDDGNDAPSLLEQEAPFLPGSPSRSTLGSDLLEESKEDLRSGPGAKTSLVNALQGGMANRVETTIRIHVAAPTRPQTSSASVDFDYTFKFSIPTTQLADQDRERRLFCVPSILMPAATSEIVTANVGGGEDEVVEAEVAPVLDSRLDEEDWSVSPLPSTGGKVKWSRSRSHIVSGGGGRDIRVGLKKIDLEGDSTIIVEEMEVESKGSPSPRRYRADSLPSLPPPLPRFDSTTTVLDTPFTVPSVTPFYLSSLSDVEESISINPIAARSISTSESLFSNPTPSQIIPISSTPPFQHQSDSSSSEPSTESLLAPLESELADSTAEPTMLRSARLSIVVSYTPHASEIGYTLVLSHQVSLAGAERRLEFTIGKGLQLDISAWNEGGSRVQLELSEGDLGKSERVVVVAWTKLVKEFIFSVSSTETRISSGHQTRKVEDCWELMGGLRSVRFGFGVGVLEIEINPHYQRVSVIAHRSRARDSMMSSPTSQLDLDGLRRFHLPRMSTVSLKIEAKPDSPSGFVARSFANGWKRFTLRNIFFVMYGLLVLVYMLSPSPKELERRKACRNVSKNAINANVLNSSTQAPTTTQILTLLPQSTLSASPATAYAERSDESKNELMVGNGEFSKLTQFLERGAIRLYSDGERTLYHLLVWLGLRRGR